MAVLATRTKARGKLGRAMSLSVMVAGTAAAHGSEPAGRVPLDAAVPAAERTIQESPVADAGAEAEHAWPRRSIEAVGLATEPILRFAEDLERGRYKYVNGISVFRNGALVFDRDFSHDYQKLYERHQHRSCPSCETYHPARYPYYAGTKLHTTQSITKTVTSAVFGVALGRGDIGSIDVAVIPLFNDRKVANLDARKRRITLRHLLTQTSGLQWDETSVPDVNPSNTLAQAYDSGDPVGFTLDRPMAAEPGSTFAYSSGVSLLLSQIFFKLTGTPIDEYARAHLFTPLGIGDYHWKRISQRAGRDRHGSDRALPHTGGGLYLRRQDLAKMGQLYLNGGRWKGRQLIPREWIEASVSPLVPPEKISDSEAPPFVAYGYQWWLIDLESYPGAEPAAERSYAWVATGWGGQNLIIIPNMDLILVSTSWNIGENEQGGLSSPEPLIDLAIALGAKQARSP